MPLIRKLERITQLSRSEHAALHTLAARTYVVTARREVISEGTKPTNIDLILEGWACRYKQLENGHRQILAILLPGDLCNSHVDLLPEMDHSVGTLTSVTVARIAQPAWQTVMADQPRIRQALEWEMTIAAAIQREWMVSLGRRNALERAAHFFCEMYVRLRRIGLNEGASCPYYLTQVELADALGLTPVHVNRCIQELRTRELIVLKDRMLSLPNFRALQRLAGFRANYLQLYQEGRCSEANQIETG